MSGQNSVTDDEEEDDDSKRQHTTWSETSEVKSELLSARDAFIPSPHLEFDLWLISDHKPTNGWAVVILGARHA